MSSHQLISVGLYLSALAAVAGLWHVPLVLGVLLALIALALNHMTDWKFIKTFIVCVAGGCVAEIIATHYGAWRYANPDIFGIPLWLLPLWGIAGLFFRAVSDFFAEG